MKRFLLATTAVLCCAGQLHAASRHRVTTPQPPPPPPFSWTGCYVGGHIGAGWGRSTIGDPNPNPFFAPAGAGIGIDQGAGALGGGQVGCDYEFLNNWVVGAAGDFSFADIDGHAQDPYFAGKTGSGVTLQDRTEWLATATARLGYAFDHWLVYGKGGAAWTRNSYGITNLRGWGTPGNFCSNGVGFTSCNPTGSGTQDGWTLGFGIAYAFANAWSAGVEYDHYDFGSHTTLLTTANAIAPNPSAPINAAHSIDAIKFTLDYHFGWHP